MIEELKSLARNTLPAGAYGRIRALRVKRFIAGYRSRIVEHDYAGLRLRVHLEDPLAEGWYDRDWPEPAEIAELRKGRLRPGANVIDVGAHQGVVGLILASIVGPTGSVTAVEAEPHNASVARRNAAANGAGNMTVVHAAVGAANGALSFTEGLNGHVAPAGHPGAIEVPALTVDEVADRHGQPDVVFIDVEGFEAHVLAGAARTLARAATDFFVELHSTSQLASAGSSIDDVMCHFSEDRYEVVVALAGDTPPGVDSTALEGGWQPVGSGVLGQGRRCFVIARPRSGAAQDEQRATQVVGDLDEIGRDPRVIVAIPTYNRATMLERAVGSVLAQDYGRVTVLISDNASTDGTQALCARLSEDSRVIVSRRPANIGLTANFNWLAREARRHAAGEGLFFMFLADDDWLDPNYLRLCVGALRQRNDCVLAAGRTLAHVDGQPTSYAPDVNIESETGPERLIDFCARVVPTGVFSGVMSLQLLRHLPPQRNVVGNDWIVFAHIVYLGKVVTVPDTIVHRGGGGASATLPNLAATLGVSRLQAAKPLVTVAILLVEECLYRSAVFGELSSSRRIRLAVGVVAALLSRRTGPLLGSPDGRGLRTVGMAISRFQRFLTAR